MSQHEPLVQELTVSHILRKHGKQFKQIQMQYSDGANGRCAIGVILSYYGWDGANKIDLEKNLLATLNELRHVGIDRELLIDMNDSGFTFDQIADYLDRYYELPNLK
jgi:hypothetical protein